MVCWDLIGTFKSVGGISLSLIIGNAPNQMSLKQRGIREHEFIAGSFSPDYQVYWVLILDNNDNFPLVSCLHTPYENS